jgi:hypothetical protein
MSNFSGILLEASGIGILTLIIGRVIFYTGIDKEKREEAEKYNTHLNLTLFMIGFLLHFMMEYSGINNWYCNKKCINGLKDIAQL